MKKIIIISSILLLSFIILITFTNNTNEENVAIQGDEENIIVASCPTFHYVLEKLSHLDWVNTIKTNSTGDSLTSYRNGDADIVISGRPLKNSEPNLISEKIGDGYDFIFIESFNIEERDMELLTFYTDLPMQEIIDDFQHITEENLTEIDSNVVDYITKGIVITSLEDKLIGGTVNIFSSDGRVRITRTPRIHYPENINKEKLNIIKEAVMER